MIPEMQMLNEIRNNNYWQKKKTRTLQFVATVFLGFPKATTTIIPIMKVLLCAPHPKGETQNLGDHGN
jgi:hypothetical protein